MVMLACVYVCMMVHQSKVSLGSLWVLIFILELINRLMGPVRSLAFRL